MDTLNVKKMRENAVLPRRATPGSAGCDLCACLDTPLVIPAGERRVIPTGIAIEIAAPGMAGFVFGRSGLGIRHGIAPSNAVGVIDADYRGELLVGLTNYAEEDYTVQPAERIAQLVLLPVCMAEVVERQTLSDTQRGSGGFGSTGRGSPEESC